MISKYFIDRPIFAWVVSLGIVLAGLISLKAIPLEQYPEIAPPTVEITATYPGASAKAVEEAVTTLIEREMNGAPGLAYTSASSSANMAQISVVFEQGTDVNIAGVEVQNRLKAVEARLPEQVRRNGIIIEKASSNFAMIIALTSEDGSWNEVQLGELSSSTLLQSLRRVPGVGKVQMFGTESAIRIWPDPAKLAAAGLTANDLSSVLRIYSARVIVGAIGSQEVPDTAPISANIASESPYTTPESFESIPLRANPDGSSIRIKDVARVELGAAETSTASKLNGKPASGLAIKLAPGSNILDTTDLVRASLEESKKLFPKGVIYEVPVDSSEFVRISVEGVVHTLIEAIVLVFIVMYLFMQNFRATIIPALVVPVALLGTLAALLALGYSINVLTMFGMVLAIGILVDDAIVVVENVERIMREEKLSPYQATIKAMSQISGAIIGITVVLIAVFIPMAFFGGVVGNVYRQFSMTLTISIAFSAFLALTLTPALCATLLKPVDEEHHHKTGFFGWFNRTFDSITHHYTHRIDLIVHKPLRWAIAYGLIAVITVLLFLRLPSSFIPEEDQGSFMVMINKPQGSPLAETMKSLGEVQKHLLEKEPIRYVYVVGGWSFFGAGTNTGIMFTKLKHWDERKDSDHSVYGIIERTSKMFAGRDDFSVFVLNQPPLPGLGNSTGFDFRLQDRANIGTQKFSEARNQLLGMANQDKNIGFAYFSGVPDTAELELKLDREKAEAMGVSVAEINATLGIMFGSDYIGDFVLNSQVRKIIVQAEGVNRLAVQDVGKLYVRGASGEMVPLSSFVTMKWTVGPPQLSRFNGFPSMSISGSPPPGKSSGDAMSAMEAIVKKLPTGIGFEWAAQSAEELESSRQAPILYALSLLIVFLALAALYESWTIPIAVLLVVPLGILGAVFGVTVRGLPNDIYFRVGLIATIGLSAKNAILIVEVAKDLHEEGKELYAATIEAAKLRLRPIIMTSLAFGVGVIPLVLSSGAGSGAQTAIGTGVLGGIIFATVLAIFLVPMFFVLVMRYLEVHLASGKHMDKDNDPTQGEEASR